MTTPQLHHHPGRDRSLQEAIGRIRGSIEYKHQNISAALKGLGEDWIPGYKPAFNFRGSLVDAVARWLVANPAWLSPDTRLSLAEGAQPSRVQETLTLWIGAAPTLGNAPPPDELEQMQHIARRFHVAERDACNRALGWAGEERNRC